jgi:hypothetical protein
MAGYPPTFQEVVFGMLGSLVILGIMLVVGILAIGGGKRD